MVSEQMMDRLRNWPGRQIANSALKLLRRSALSLLPSAPISHCGRIIAEMPVKSRWLAVKPSLVANFAERVACDRSSRAETLRVFEGDLVIDPYSTLLLSNRQILWGSKDSIGREREPHLSSFFAKPKLFCKEIISLRGMFEDNYFHFFYDTLIKLMLCELHVALDTPVLVSTVLASQPFFQDCLKMGIFGKRPILTQNNTQLVGANRVYVPSPSEPGVEHLTAIARRFGADRLPKEPTLKLYVARGRQATNKRRLRNEAALFRELEKRGFIFFDPQEHDLPTQISTFARAGLIVSPHGAGLTNVIWRQNAPLTVVELVNPSMSTLDMAYLSTSLGHRHCIVDNLNDYGDPLRSSANADIPAVLRVVDGDLSRQLVAG